MALSQWPASAVVKESRAILSIILRPECFNQAVRIRPKRMYSRTFPVELCKLRTEFSITIFRCVSVPLLERFDAHRQIRSSCCDSIRASRTWQATRAITRVGNLELLSMLTKMVSIWPPEPSTPLGGHWRSWIARELEEANFDSFLARVEQDPNLRRIKQKLGEDLRSLDGTTRRGSRSCNPIVGQTI